MPWAVGRASACFHSPGSALQFLGPNPEARTRQEGADCRTDGDLPAHPVVPRRRRNLDDLGLGLELALFISGSRTSLPQIR